MRALGLQYKLVINMELQLTDLAAAKLRLLLWEEKDYSDLAIRVVLLTSGCNTPSFGLEVTEQKENMRRQTFHDIPFVWYPEDEDWLVSISIDLNRENGKFIIDHPDSSLLTNCRMEPRGDGPHLDK